VTDKGADADRQRLTLQEAAHRLGVSESAIRKRVKRGTLDSVKTEKGRVLVYLDEGAVPSAPGADTTTDTETLTSVLEALVASSREQMATDPNTEALASALAAKDETIALLKQQLEAQTRANDENRRIIGALTERLALPPPETSDTPTYDVETAAPTDDATDTTEHTGGPRRSWWRRWLYRQ
jgi:excisionase family DNA binding protein